MNQRLIDQLNKRKKQGTIRSLSNFEGFIDFFSNDYLGLAKEPSQGETTSYGGTGSRLISGTSKEALRAERDLADFFSAEAALMFNSGYDANVGVFSSILQRGDVVLFDEFIHASVRDGIRLSYAESRSFSHNNLRDLEEKLKKTDGTVYVAVEGLYSMGGDLAPLRDISELCQKYNACLIVDEAHSSGIFGEQGKGLTAALGLEQILFARIVTFGKAYGSHGSCVLGSQILIDYLTNFARPFIYSTALPPSVYNRNVQMAKSASLEESRKKLQAILHYFRSNFSHPGLISEVNSPIQIFQIGEIERTRELANRLQEAGLAVKPIFSPTVPEGKESLRICFHSYNEHSDVDQLIHQIST